MTVNQLVPVAQYLRMSTEHQQYSLQNQSIANGRYAKSRGFEVIQIYSDAGTDYYTHQNITRKYPVPCMVPFVQPTHLDGVEEFSFGQYQLKK